MCVARGYAAPQYQVYTKRGHLFVDSIGVAAGDEGHRHTGTGCLCTLVTRVIIYFGCVSLQMVLDPEHTSVSPLYR